jgi:hypothetical protein
MSKATHNAAKSSANVAKIRTMALLFISRGNPDHGSG